MGELMIEATVTGACPQCGMPNAAEVPTWVATTVTHVLVTASASCGACGTPVELAGDATEEVAERRAEGDAAM